MKFIHCPYCGNKLIPRDIGDEGLTPYCETCNQPIFNMPYACTLTLVVNELREVALIKQSYVSQTNYVLVAGYIKSGENAEETSIREVQEEIGVSVHTLRYVKSYYLETRDMLMLGFVAFADKCPLSISIEVDAAEWVPLEEAKSRLKEGSIAMQLLLDYLETEGKINEGI